MVNDMFCIKLRAQNLTTGEINYSSTNRRFRAAFATTIAIGDCFLDGVRVVSDSIPDGTVVFNIAPNLTQNQ